MQIWLAVVPDCVRHNQRHSTFKSILRSLMYVHTQIPANSIGPSWPVAFQALVEARRRPIQPGLAQYRGLPRVEQVAHLRRVHQPSSPPALANHSNSAVQKYDHHNMVATPHVPLQNATRPVSASVNG